MTAEQDGEQRAATVGPEALQVEQLEQAPLSEAGAFRQILQFAAGRPNWQQDALRRLIKQSGSLTDRDVDELFEICLNSSAPFRPLTEEDMQSDAVSGSPISLISVENPIGINALVDDQGVDFSPTGLTVVYGDNGSGKSGYVRILKDACRSRDEKFEILPDIARPYSGEQSARITYKIGTEVEEFLWSPEIENHPHLPSVSIFDSRSATTHLSGQHHLAYTPFPLLVLKELATLCDLIKSRITSRIKELEAQTPEVISGDRFNPDTAAGAFLSKLSGDTKQSEIDLLTELNDDEEKRLIELQSDLAGEPQKIVATLDAQRRRLQRHLENLERFVADTNSSKFQELGALRSAYDMKSAVAKAASEDLFAASPLPDIGGDLWKALWESARAYSDQQANPERAFPDVEADIDLCVLCQQPVGAEAKQKWTDFEKFVKGNTKADEAAALAALKSEVEKVSEKRISKSEALEVKSLVGDELGQTTVAADLHKCWVVACFRLRSLLRGNDPTVEACPVPKDAISPLIDQISKRIIDLDTEIDSDARKALVNEYQGLKDRKALKLIKKDVESHVSRLSEIEKLKLAMKQTAKNAVTARAGELSEQLVTASLRGRFRRETQKLNMISAPVDLVKARDRSGQSFFNVELTERPAQPIGDILSEGEHRCIALAAFMAELVTANEYSGIVFDDPMSSLDHLFRAKVANRLVEEAEHRQVVVFTHDLTFLFELSKHAENQNVNLHFRTVRRTRRGPGIVEDDLPFKARQAWSMENSIRSTLKSCKGNFDQLPEDVRSTMATGIIAKIRSSWEQGIADFVRPVLAQMDSHIKPGSFFKLLPLDEQDVKDVEAARSRLSELGDIHASSETLNPSELSHADLVTELNVFRDWFQRLNEKQKKAKSPSP